jgi:hypothetical protein
VNLRQKDNFECYLVVVEDVVGTQTPFCNTKLVPQKLVGDGWLVIRKKRREAVVYVRYPLLVRLEGLFACVVRMSWPK